jgi:hypothetical protein
MRNAHSIQVRWSWTDSAHRANYLIGEMEVDEEKFDDWDEGCHGPIDTEHTRKEFPENFSWTCCNSDGTTEGCVTGHHSPAVHKKQRV